MEKEHTMADKHTMADDVEDDTFDLSDAVLTRDKEKVAKLLQSGADPNQIPDHCIYELIQGPEDLLGEQEVKQIPESVTNIPVHTHDDDMLKVLIKGGLRLKRIPDPAIYRLVRTRDISVLKILIERRFDMNLIPDYITDDLIHTYNIGLLTVLIDGGLDFKRIPDPAIYRLVHTRDIGILKILIERGLDLNRIPDSIIDDLVYTRDIDLMKVLIQGGLNLKRIPDNVEYRLAHTDDDEMLKVLLERGLQLNRIPDSAVDKIVHTADIGLLKILIEGGLEVKRIPDSAVEKIMHTADIKLIKTLVEGGFEVNRIPNSVIYSIILAHDDEMLLFLKERGLEKIRTYAMPYQLYSHKEYLRRMGLLIGLPGGGMRPQQTRTLENTSIRSLDRPRSSLHPFFRFMNSGIKDSTKFMSVVQENNMEAFMSLKDRFVNGYPHWESSWTLLHIVAVYGTAEMVDCIQRWTKIDWDRQHDIHEHILKLALKSLKVKAATALYLATYLERTEIVRSLVKLAGEDNIQSCLQGLHFSNEMEEVYMLELANRLRKKHANLQPIIVPGHQRDSTGTQSRVFIVYSVSVNYAEDYDFNGLGLVKLRNPYVIRRTNSVALVREIDISKKDAEAKPDKDEGLSNPGVDKLPDDDEELPSEDGETFSNEEIKKVTDAIQTHRDRLWVKHSNLNIITGKQVKRIINGFYIQEACVVLYCSTKGVIPLGENVFPRTLSIQNGDYVNVAVREGFFDFGGYATTSGTSRHDYLKMGCEIGRSTPQFDTRGRSIHNGGGTLGPFVRFNNDLGFLTCAHVLFDIPSHSYSIDFTAAFAMVQVAQPSRNSTASVSATECGVVERAVFDPSRTVSIDATVVKITDQSRKPTAGRFSNERHSTYVDAGFKELPEYNNGVMIRNADLNALHSKPNVVKFGSRTDVTKGALAVVGADVRAYSKALGFGDSAAKVLMENQYLVTGIPPSTDFFDGGDSGSAVFYQDENGQLVCIGMAIGYCVLNDYPYKAGIVTPIDAILQALGPNFKLAAFP